MKSSYSQSQMDQKNYLEEIRFWEHPPWSGIVQNEERNKKFFNENKTDSSPTPHQDDSTREDVEAQHDFLSITRDFIYRHHVEPRVKLYMPREESFPFPLWKLSTLPETLINHWMYFWRKKLMVIGTWLEKENYPMRRQDSQDSFYFRKGHQKDAHGPGGDLRWNKQPLVLMMCGQICGNLCPMQRKRKQNKDGLSRNQSSTMPDNREEYSSLNQTTKNSSSQWKPLVESVKFRCRQQCLAKYRQRAVDKPTAILGNATQNTLVLSIPTNARDQG